MTESSQLHDSVSLECFFQDEPFDYAEYDEDDISCDTENIDALDEEKIELIDLAEKETDFSNETFISSFNNIIPSGCQNYMPTMNFSNIQANIPNQQYNTTWTQDGQIRFPEFINNTCNINTHNFSGSNHFQTITNEPNASYPLDPMLRSLIANPTLSHSYNDKYVNVPQDKLCKQSHIKKPLNAFMLYMRDVRPDVLKQVPHKDSTTINQMIGKLWQALSKEDQSIYFERAREEREKHKKLYPEYNPRDYYAQSLKKRRRKRDKQINEPLPKKCRARFGVNQQEKWCKHCKRKKKCLRYAEGQPDSDIHINEQSLIEKTDVTNLILSSNTVVAFPSR